MSKTIRFPFHYDNSITTKFAKYHGKPNSTRSKRALVKKSNPLHYTFGNVRPVWKTWENYATNMELIHGGMYEDEDNQDIPQAEQS